MGDNQSIRREIKVAILLVLGQVAKEDAGCGARGELMGCSGGKVRITQAAKDAEMIIGGWRAKKGLVGSGKGNGPCRVTIQKISGGMEGFNPVGQRSTSLDQQGA